jgi:hypothetical protein
MKSILDRSFRYTPSAHTDVRKTFARIRKQQAEQQAANQRAEEEVREPARKMATMFRIKAGGK